MIWTMVKKEIINNIITFRFTLGTVLFLSLLVFFMSVLINDYKQKLENYNELIAKNDSEFRKLMTYRNLKPTVYKPPEILSIFSKGIEESIGNSARVSIDEVPFSKGAAVSGKNPLISIFPVFDIVLIFKYVISMFILLFAYDAVAGEKEDKTLGLILSNSIPRHQVLLGKFIGGMITIAIIIMMGFLIGGIILVNSPVIKLSSSEWFRIVLMFFISLILVGVLYSLGLFISSLTKKASDALMILLFIWILYVLVIPDLSVYVTSHIEVVESREKIDSKVKEIWEEYRNKLRDILNNLYLLSGHSTESDEEEPWGYYMIYATKTAILNEKKETMAREPLKIEYAERVWQVEHSYTESLKRQKSFSDIFNRFSSVSIYEILISGIARSDIPSSEKFFEQAKEYRQQIINYLYSINAFSLTRYFSTVNEKDLLDFKQGDRNYIVFRDKYIKEKPLPLNTENIPKFQFKHENIIGTLIRILPDIALLIIMGILFFLLSFVAFLRYDAR